MQYAPVSGVKTFLYFTFMQFAFRLSCFISVSFYCTEHFHPHFKVNFVFLMPRPASPVDILRPSTSEKNPSIQGTNSRDDETATSRAHPGTTMLYQCRSTWKAAEFRELLSRCMEARRITAMFFNGRNFISYYCRGFKSSTNKAIEIEDPSCWRTRIWGKLVSEDVLRRL